MKLNLGCGLKKREGWINVDSKKVVNPDKIIDLEKFPYPFQKNSVEEIYMAHTLEHLHNTLKVLKEFERICKNRAVITIVTPHYLNSPAWADITHVKAFSGQSFDVLNLVPEYFNLNLKLTSTRYISFRGLNFILNINKTLTELFFARFLPINEIEFKLVKNA